MLQLRCIATAGLALLWLVPISQAQDSTEIDWWSNRSNVQAVEQVTLAGEGEYLRLADGATSGYVEGEVDFGGGFLTIRELIYGVAAGPSGMDAGESIRLRINGAVVAEFDGLQAGKSRFDTLTAWGLSGNSTVLAYRVEFESASGLGAEHALWLRGRAVRRGIDVVIGRNTCALSPNSAGPGAFLVALGSASVGQENLELVVSSAPPATFGLCLYGSEDVRTPFGDGYLCLGGGAVGLVPLGEPRRTSAAGQLEQALDFLSPPVGSGPAAITPGSTWSFQFWYRDGGSFNTSEALRITFQS